MFFPLRRAPLEGPQEAPPQEAPPPPSETPRPGPSPTGELPPAEVTVLLSGVLRGREEARSLLEEALPEASLRSPVENVILEGAQVTVMGQRFVVGVMEVLFYEGRATYLTLREVPPHALLYFREEAYQHGLSQALTVVPRSPRSSNPLKDPS